MDHARKTGAVLECFGIYACGFNRRKRLMLVYVILPRAVKGWMCTFRGLDEDFHSYIVVSLPEPGLTSVSMALERDR